MSEKDGEPRNQVPEEGFKGEEGWHEILNSLQDGYQAEYQVHYNDRKKITHLQDTDEYSLCWRKLLSVCDGDIHQPDEP